MKFYSCDHKGCLKNISEFALYDKMDYDLSIDEFNCIVDALKKCANDNNRGLYERMKSFDKHDYLHFKLNRDDSLLAIEALKNYISVYY